MDRSLPRRAAAQSARWLWLALLMTPPLAAQDSRGSSATAGPGLAQPAPGDQAPQADPDARVRKRLLRARGGGVLRAESRRHDGRWEYRREGGREWLALPEGLVESARLESEALEDLRGRRAALGRAAAPALVELAAWALGEGLYDEALALLDDVLQADPDQPEALQLLRRDDLPFGMPSRADGRRDELLQFASAAPPALREMAVARLAGLPDQPALRDALRERLTSAHASERELAALALRRLPAEAGSRDAELQELLRRAARDVSADVRRGAALALRDAGQPGLVVPLVTALGSASPWIRTHSAEALGLMGYGAAVPALVARLSTLPASGGGGGYVAPRSSLFVGTQTAFVQGFDVDIAQQAAIGDPEIGTLQAGVSLDVAVLGASGPGYVSESAALRTALERLTGARPGNSVAAWKGWWEAHRPEWEPAEPASGAGS